MLSTTQLDVVIEVKEYSTVIVAFNLADDERMNTDAQSFGQYAVPDLHMTLLFMGDMANYEYGGKTSKEVIMKFMEDFAANQAPIQGKFNGAAVFDGDAGVKPVVLLYDSPQMPFLRTSLRESLSRTVTNELLQQDHGFTPHVTLAYVPQSATVPIDSWGKVDYDKVFDTIWLFWGDEHYPFKLTGTEVYKQLPIDEKSRANLIKARVEIFKNDSGALSEDMYSGKISLGEWQESMKKMIRELHSSAAAIGKGGWDNMTKSDWGRIGSQVKEQYRYLQGFAEKVATDRESISLEAIQARARMYGEAARNSASLAQAGEFAGGTARQPGRFEGLPWIPGDGSTECLVNCKCHWELFVVSKTKTTQLVQATWIMAQIEDHCDTCPQRNGHIVVMEVPADVVVPNTIGIGYE